MKKDNPFTLTFGKRPTEYISRFEATEMIVSTFTADNPVGQIVSHRRNKRQWKDRADDSCYCRTRTGRRLSCH